MLALVRQTPDSSSRLPSPKSNPPRAEATSAQSTASSVVHSECTDSAADVDEEAAEGASSSSSTASSDVTHDSSGSSGSGDSHYSPSVHRNESSDGQLIESDGADSSGESEAEGAVEEEIAELLSGGSQDAVCSFSPSLLSQNSDQTHPQELSDDSASEQGPARKKRRLANDAAAQTGRKGPQGGLQKSRNVARPVAGILACSSTLAVFSNQLFALARPDVQEEIG